MMGCDRISPLEEDSSLGAPPITTKGFFMRNKKNDLELLASKLDISPTMYKYAVERYMAICEYLESRGIAAEMSPQGSFRTGTVTRPLKDGAEADYDIDVVCKLLQNKQSTDPKVVKHLVGDALQASDLYRSRLLPEDARCWTLEYAKVMDDIGFKLDVVPAVKDTPTKILQLVDRGVDIVYARDAISITDRLANMDYTWAESNPQGFGSWFDNINAPFLAAGLEDKKKRFLKENSTLFASTATIEDVPDHYIKSALQRVIQLLKRHCDIHYARVEKGEELRPASVIITALAAKIASETVPTASIDELLSYVVNGMRDYAGLLQGRKPAARHADDQRDFIDKRDRKWWIPNPVNPDDNYADSWTDDTAKEFFRWVDAVCTDLAGINVDNEVRYMAGLRTSFGKEFVDKHLPLEPSVQTRIPTPSVRPTKPWRAN